MEDAVPFELFMEAALYDDELGFYTAGGGMAGRRGDFITSPEVGPLFGAVLARWLDDHWNRLGRPDPYEVLDVGAGPGTLGRSVRIADPACRDVLRFTFVERSPEARRRHEGLGRSIASLDEVDPGTVHVVVANELLDNLAVRLLERDSDGWQEVCVGPGGPCLRPAAPLPPVSAAVLDALDAPVGVRVPVPERAAAWVRQAREALVLGGRLLVFDYGVHSTAALSERPWESWLRTYRHHGRGVSPFEQPGGQDITCEVAFDQLPPSDDCVVQAVWLRRWGIEELVDEGRRIWTERAALGDLAALRARSRISEAAALLDPEGLGAFLVSSWTAR